MSSSNPAPRYTFKRIEACNMCGAPASRFRVMGKRLGLSGGRSPHKKMSVATTVVRCAECSLIFANPMPVPFSLQDHYGVAPEEYWDNEYFQVGEAYYRHELNVLRKLKDLPPGSTALDVGAGLGKCMVAMSKDGLEAYGLEASPQFYERAISGMGILPERLKLATIEEADYPAGSFDFITFGAVLEHLYDPAGAILKSLEWLKPGGIIHIEVPSSKWLIGKLINAFYALRGLDYVGNISPMHNPYHLYEFGLESFRRHAQANGYRVLHHEYYVGATAMPAIIRPVAESWMRATDSGMQLCVWLTR